MFNFFKKKTVKTAADFSALGVDLHSHLVPGIDDGAPDLDTSLALIRQLAELGYSKIITTPHVMGDYYPNSSRTILEGLEKVKTAVQAASIAVELQAAAEYHLDENFEKLLDVGDILTLPGNRLLFELPFFGEPPGIEHTVFSMCTKAYKPILAHPERYPYYLGKMATMHRFKDMGCTLQVNILSLTGHYGEPTKKWAHQLIKEKIVDYLGTDLHHQRHIDLLKKSLQQVTLQKILSETEFKNRQLSEGL